MAAQQTCGSCPATYKPTHSPLWGLGRAIPASTAVCLLGEGCCVPLREPRSVCSQDGGGVQAGNQLLQSAATML